MASFLLISSVGPPQSTLQSNRSVCSDHGPAWQQFLIIATKWESGILGFSELTILFQFQILSGHGSSGFLLEMTIPNRLLSCHCTAATPLAIGPLTPQSLIGMAESAVQSAEGRGRTWQIDMIRLETLSCNLGTFLHPFPFSVVNPIPLFLCRTLGSSAISHAFFFKVFPSCLTRS